MESDKNYKTLIVNYLKNKIKYLQKERRKTDNQTLAYQLLTVRIQLTKQYLKIIQMF
jgi:hypothetical protein